MEWINLDVFSQGRISIYCRFNLNFFQVPFPEIFHQFIGEDDFVNKFTYLLLRY